MASSLVENIPSRFQLSESQTAESNKELYIQLRILLIICTLFFHEGCTVFFVNLFVNCKYIQIVLYICTHYHMILQSTQITNLIFVRIK